MDANGKIAILKDKKGITIVFVALLIIVLVAIIGLAVDIGYMYVAKGQLQNAADSAALAGAARLNGSTFTNQTGARLEAWRFASSNQIVPSGKTVFLIASSSRNAPPGNLNNGNDVDGDIVLGHWYGPHDFRPRPGVALPTGDIINAVKIVARATSSSAVAGIKRGDNPVPIFFGKILGWNQMSATSEAYAAIIPGPILPISVNEYWLQKDASKRPYPDPVHTYPDSFVRVTNVDGTASLAFGKIFGILGSEANDNMPPGGGGGSKNMNGYVNMDDRTSRHDGAGTTWYEVITGLSGAINCATCASGFNGPLAPNSGFISSAKFDTNFIYLMNGYPDNQILATAVREQLRTPISDYPGSPNYYIEPTSSCPYATNAYFSNSGNQPLNKKDANGKSFSDIYPPGKKIITMVYDGSFVSTADPSMPNAITNVGYVLLQIDGYANTNPKNLDLDKTTNNLSTNGTTVYAHALADIVQPSSTFGTCDMAFFNAVQQLRIKGGTVKLVDGRPAP